MIDGVLVLAAGKSTRIAEFSMGVPKPLLEIAGKPIIVHTFEWLVGHGIHAAWVNLHHEPDSIRSRLGDGRQLGVALRYSIETQILGTAGAWKKLRREWSTTSLVIYGDNLMRFDLGRFLDAHRAAGRLMTAALYDPDVHANTGIAAGYAVLGRGSRIERFVEGPVARGDRALVNAGAYLIEPPVADCISDGVQDFGKDVLPHLALAGDLAGCVLERDAFCLGLDTPAAFARGEELVQTGNLSLL